MQPQQISHSFTLKHKGFANTLLMPVNIAVPDQVQKFSTKAIWDTGATGTVITQEVVDALKLLPTGMEKVNTASETGVLTHTFLIDLYLKHDLRIHTVKVTLGKIAPGIGCLIGMDIITLGDFSITNFNGNTCMTFRIPSQHEIDYVQHQQELNKQQKTQQLKDARNKLYKK